MDSRMIGDAVDYLFEVLELAGGLWRSSVRVVTGWWGRRMRREPWKDSGGFGKIVSE